MRGVMDLDIMEACSVLSSISTLAIALTSWYQIRRDTLIGYVPMVVIDDFAWSDGRLVAQIRNYGTGPALDVKLWGMRGRDAVPIAPMVDGRRVTGLHLAPAEAKCVHLVATRPSSERGRADVPEEIRIRYYSVRGRTFEGRAEIPQDLRNVEPQSELGQAGCDLPE
ncbi:hypothetical protein Aaci_2257 [Alicyclobacillus acidocaldarius subsp. acidocaldarius DSM 446]|uniref:Uncharacterized protein n=1 Tax=Alicyclobacillus acidocaldarius subsp. acidocaldarius (strain ATCC 27009 / DSM 446 / BCRC 14685 / JCM 5260 / KCTC 1825 / NBRC 15652 / NCIMB 11725 / NRRL B-14509 / 104-IA) TaxID=521098 RepID=C8WR97_ALIAD|nr:hypothetical protein Aaci_2257 [Alicyclobacillus acidocaldarius subsp. acidocaldarius DSM 446]